MSETSGPLFIKVTIYPLLTKDSKFEVFRCVFTPIGKLTDLFLFKIQNLRVLRLVPLN